MIDYVKIMGVEQLHSEARRGRGVSIAILDSGEPRIECLPGYLSACSFCEQDSSTSDYFGHATAISSILFGGNGIRGLCEEAIPCYGKVLDRDGAGSVESVVRGIYYAIHSNVDLINLSLGFFRTKNCPKRLQDACQAAYDAGKVIICAAGNDNGAVNWPAALKTTICIGSAVRKGRKSEFSSFGEVDFVVPGENLPVFDKKGRISYVSGTSFATALVSGVSALVIAKFKQENRKINTNSVYKALKCMANDIGAPNWDDNTGNGLISGFKGRETAEMLRSDGFFGTIVHRLKRLYVIWRHLFAKGGINGG